MADIRAFSLPLSPEDSYAACIAFASGDAGGDVSEVTWLRFLLWMAAGLIVYYAYGRKHSKVAN